MSSNGICELQDARSWARIEGRHFTSDAALLDAYYTALIAAH